MEKPVAQGRALPAVCAVIVAGGAGTRFGNPGGKLLVELAGAPLMSWTLRAFDAASCIRHIVIVCPASAEAAIRARAVEPFALSTPVTFARSGDTRQASARAGVAAVPRSCAVAAIHDAARPLIQPATIERAVAALAADPAADGAVCGQPAIDTLKTVAPDGTIAATPDRARFWCVQTPQVFPVAVLVRAYERADAEDFTGTDDASMVERAGGRVLLVESPRDNLKVTVPEDLVPADAILRARLAAARR